MSTPAIAGSRARTLLASIRTIHPLIRSLGIVTVGNMAGAALSFAVLVVLARALAAHEFAVIACIMAIVDGGQLFLATLLSTGVVTVAAREGATRKPSLSALRAGFFLMVVAGAGFAILMGLLSVPLSRVLVGDHTYSVEVAVAGCAAALLGLHGFLTGVLQVREDFARLALLSASKNFFRLLFVILALAAGAFDPRTITFCIAAAALSVCVLGALSVRWDFLRDRAPLVPELAKIGAINSWMALAAVALFASRLDVWLVSYLSTPRQAGLYALAVQLSLGVGVLSQAVVTALLPTMVRPRAADETARILKWLVYAIPAIAGLGFLAWLVADPIIAVAFGPSYVGAGAVFAIVLSASLMTLAGGPLMLLLLSLHEARILGLTSVGQTVARVLLAILLVPSAGAVGGALSDIGARVLAIAGSAYFIQLALGRGLRDGSLGQERVARPRSRDGR